MIPSWIASFPVSCLFIACATSGERASIVVSHEESVDYTVTVACSTTKAFACDAGRSRCISTDHVCNGIPDCENGSDEAVITCGCLPNEFQCNNTHCIDLVKRCDLSMDCQDGADEDNCETYECPVSHFKCRNHKCVPRDKTCDFENDCGDQSDEDFCKRRPCMFGEFECDNRECIIFTRICDGVTNCKDGSDEIQARCDEHFRCSTGFYVSSESLCDGWADCKISKLDEAKCGECTDDQYQCTNGQCISKFAECDGVCDCTDCQDESFCGNLYCDSRNHYICRRSLRCIPIDRVCDGNNDCMDSDQGFDEYNCHNSSDCSTFTRLRGVPSHWCEGRCLPQQAKCNMFAECADGSDEDGCDATDFTECKEDTFQCGNHRCVPSVSRCDGKNDCWDWSDEKRCDFVPCPSGQVKCNSGQCIPDYKWCNHWPNCPDGSDEEHCEYRSCGDNEFQCNNGECIPESLVCYNGKKQEHHGCDDQSHLIDCESHQCADGQFKCLKSFCVDKEQVCDHNVDCLINVMDEANCPYPCPIGIKKCECFDQELRCGDRGLQEVPMPMENERITKFHLAGNNLASSLTSFTFNETHLDSMSSLDISRNGLKTIPPNMFISLWRLTYLNLAENFITKIHNSSFSGLHNLRQLFVQGNGIEELDPGSFIDMGQLPTLDLSQQKLTQIDINTFQGLRSLLLLNLSGNRLTYLQSGVFNGLDGLMTLDISNNQLSLIEKHVFYSLPSLTLLLTDEFRFCCMASGVQQCYPEGDEFSSCEDLMSNLVLRVCIWILGLMASLGNALVILWRARTVRGSKVHSFLITNLAIGDLLMGVYLVIIAGVDLHYRGVYILHEAEWKTSVLCKLAGFFSMFSSELSVLTLTVITLDRLCCIIFPLRVKRLRVKEAIFVMLLVWILVFVISFIPLAGIDYFGNFYGRSGVCLALPVTPAQPPGWEYSIAVFLVLNFLSFLIIAVAYVWMFLVAKEIRSAVRSGETKTDTAMARRMTLIVMTDFVCWVPIILLGFASMAGAHASNQVYAWIAVFILPINSAINPVLYTLSTAPFVGTVQKRAMRFRKSFMTSVTADNGTKASFVDDRTVHSYTDRRSSPRPGEALRMKTIRVNVPGYSGKSSSDI